MTNTPEETYNYICFSELAYELDSSDPKVIEKKIKRRLKYYKLAAYNQERVDHIRTLKNDLYQEITLQSKSKYYTNPTSGYAQLNDFDTVSMNSEFLKKYPEMDVSDMLRIIYFAIYLYYIR